jgi:site-specific DNA recombinase
MQSPQSSSPTNQASKPSSSVTPVRNRPRTRLRQQEQRRLFTWAILYARVSTDEQARSGYSLAQQIEALREYAASEGYEVLEEVTDPGQSGASLARPGLDWVRDLVAAGAAP